MVLVSIGCFSFFQVLCQLFKAQTLNCATKWKRMHEWKIFLTQQKTWPFPTMSVLKDSNRDPKNQMHKRD